LWRVVGLSQPGEAPTTLHKTVAAAYLGLVAPSDFVAKVAKQQSGEDDWQVSIFPEGSLRG
jgi:hypothetical protein